MVEVGKPKKESFTLSCSRFRFFEALRSVELEANGQQFWSNVGLIDGVLRLSSELILAGTQDGFSVHVAGIGLHFWCLADELYCFEGWGDFLGIKRILQIPIQGCDFSFKVIMDG